MEPLKTDCRHFRSDRPCVPHKLHGVVCATCTEHYDPVGARLLLVKLDAPGDVLRTTSLLPAIRRRWPSAHLTWVTAPDAALLLRGNPLIDEVVPFDGALPVALAARRFDAVLNPDAAPAACALAHAVATKERVGFDLDARTGAALPLGEGAERWLQLGLRDDRKRANTATYQELVAGALGLDYRREPPQLPLGERHLARGRALRAAEPPVAGRAVIGLVTGAGTRWRFKRWTEAGMVELVRRLSADGHRVWLLGGPDEVERCARILHASGDQAVHTGCDNDLPTFAGIVDACDLVVTGDTLAMHVAIARSRPVVALFGPTSAAEIELFGRGERLQPDLDCLVCYKADCDFVPNCMESITPDDVLAAVDRCLGAAPR